MNIALHMQANLFVPPAPQNLCSPVTNLYYIMPEQHAQKPEGRNYSIIGLALAVISLFAIPVVFAPLAIIFGTIGVIKHDRNMGAAAVALGILAIVIAVAIHAI